MASLTQFVPSPAASMEDPEESFDMQATLLLAAIESFTVGLVIIAQDGTVLHRNSRAQALLGHLSYSSCNLIPDRIWRACKNLVEEEPNGLLSLDHKIVLEDEISTSQGTILVKTQRFNWEYQTHKDNNCFLITLENREQSLITIAKQEAQRYGLTTREADVWGLKRMDKTYKEIAQTLFISENTVKKHLKNIYAKKEQSKWLA
ncbi:MAG: helix-turn-helix transcriptional regulator [Cyanobacteria bacterium P01_F01_bin.116]